MREDGGGTGPTQSCLRGASNSERKTPEDELPPPDVQTCAVQRNQFRVWGGGGKVAGRWPGPRNEKLGRE